MNYKYKFYKYKIKYINLIKQYNLKQNGGVLIDENKISLSLQLPFFNNEKKIKDEDESQAFFIKIKFVCLFACLIFFLKYLL